MLYTIFKSLEKYQNSSQNFKGLPFYFTDKYLFVVKLTENPYFFAGKPILRFGWTLSIVNKILGVLKISNFTSKSK
jgi:hypothetical protein